MRIAIAANIWFVEDDHDDDVEEEILFEVIFAIFYFVRWLICLIFFDFFRSNKIKQTNKNNYFKKYY